MGPERDLASLRLPNWGRADLRPDEIVPYAVLDDSGRPVEPIGVYLGDFLACGNRSSSTRAYAYALLR